MAEEHDSLLEGTPEVSLRDGNYWVIVGQHRVEMYRQLDQKKVWVKLWHGLTEREEAFIFEQQPRRAKELRPVEIFKASLVSKNPQSIAISRILRRHGFAVRESAGPANWQAIRAAEDIYARYADGPELLDRVAQVLSKWTSEKGPRGAIIRGLATFIRDENPDLGILERVLRESGQTHDDIIRIAKDHPGFAPGSSIGGWGGVSYIAGALRKVYRRGTRRVRAA